MHIGEASISAALALVIRRILLGIAGAGRGFLAGTGPQRGQFILKLMLAFPRIQDFFLQGIAFGGAEAVRAQGDEFQMLIPSQDRAAEGGEREKNQQIISG